MMVLDCSSDPRWWFCCVILAIYFVAENAECHQQQLSSVALAAGLSSSSSAVQFSVDNDLKRAKRNIHVAANEQTQLHNINRRSLQSSSSSSSCASPPADDGGGQFFSPHPFDPPSAGGDYDTITLLWAGNDNSTRVIGLLHSTGAVDSSVYVSQGKDSYAKSNGLDGVKLSLLERNSDDLSHVLAVGEKDNAFHSCVSSNAGVNFACYKMPSTYAPAGTMLFNAELVITIMEPQYSFLDDYALVLSKDKGQSWDIVHRRATAALFKAGSKDTIFALTQIKESSPFASFGFNVFASDSQLMSVNVTDSKKPTASSIKGLNQTSVTGFQYAGDFLHVVTVDDDGHKVLKISSDHGDSFNDTHLPSTTSGQYINILNTDAQLIFAHVTSTSDASVGTLYTSGPKGLFYSQSLDNHVSDDFYNVLSMDGVYLTTRRLPDKSLSTIISTDRGAEWKPVTVKDCGKDDCTLQIYGKYLIDIHKKNAGNFVLAQAPHSSANARGLIVVQGILAPKIPYNSGSLKYTYSSTPGVFISGDGGYTWIQAPDLKGAYHLLIEDSGGVIQAVPVNEPLTKIYYSVNEGTCWYSRIITASLNNFTIKGLVSQPGQKSLNLGIVGHGSASGNSSQITWEIVDIDFKVVLQKACTPDDMENWDADPQCYLGKKRSYQRIKKTSWCYLESAADVSAKVQHCQCTRADYECDYGFVKDATTKDCVKDKKFDSVATYCLDNKVYVLESSGYRKLPGDECTGTTMYDAPSTTRSLNESCDEGDPSSFIDIAVVKAKLCNTSASSKSAGHGGLVAATVILTLISTVLCVALTVLYCKYSTLRRHYHYGAFEDPAWSAGVDRSSNQSSSGSADEGLRIAHSDNTGRSYSRLKETGAESDVDLLNM